MTLSRFQTKSFVSSLFLTLALGLQACGTPEPEECGNGIVEGGEACDDGDNRSGDGCSADCEEEQGEEDECGDGTLGAGEQCDDGNNSSGDGCSADCDEEGQSQAEQIDDYIEGLGTLNTPAPQEEAAEGNPTNTSHGPYSCTTQNFRQVKVFDSFPLQGGALAERIYPGMLLSGASLAGGNFDEVISKKKPLTLSHDVTALPIASAVLAEPSLSSFAQFQTDLLVGQLGDQKIQQQSVDVVDVTTINKDELSLQLGFDVSAGIATEVDVEGSLDFQSSTVQSRFLVRITNELYTVKIDPVSFASDFFANDVTLEQVQSLFAAGSPPVYVDTITYGRELYVSVTSTFSEQEVQAALEIAVANDAANFDSTLDFGLSARQVLDETTVTGIIVGPLAGDAGDLGKLSGSEQLKALGRLKTREAFLSKDNLGQPISFTVRYLPSAFGNANSAVDASYPRETCERVRQNIRVKLVSIQATNVNDEGDDLEVYGTIQAKSLDSGAQFGLLMNRASNAPLSLADSSTPNSGSNVQEDIVLEIRPQEAKNILLTFNLNDADQGQDDDLIDFKSKELLFLDGFDGEYKVDFSTPSGDLEFTFQLETIAQ